MLVLVAAEGNYQEGVMQEIEVACSPEVLLLGGVVGGLAWRWVAASQVLLVAACLVEAYNPGQEPHWTVQQAVGEHTLQETKRIPV